MVFESEIQRSVPHLLDWPILVHPISLFTSQKQHMGNSFGIYMVVDPKQADGFSGSSDLVMR